jgi:hypothetical protein
MNRRGRITGIFLIIVLGVSAIAIAEGDENAEVKLVRSHKATHEDIEQLKELMGVYDPSVNYNVIIDGHGTGLQPPTEEEWDAMVGNLTIVDEIRTPTAPPAVDNAATNWFPPIGNQDGEGSCVTWAVGYYMKTFQEAKEHNWDLSGVSWTGGYYGQPSAERDKIMSPDFIYHQINNGVDHGSSFGDAINLVCHIGASSWQTMPYSPSDHVSWPSEAAWREAPLYRGDGGYHYASVTSGVGTLKNWLADGNLAVIVVAAGEYSKLDANDLWTVDTYSGTGLNHANTIVGYDDTFGPYTEQGQQRYGAFKVANSWGLGFTGDHNHDGFYWISYEAMRQRVKGFYFYYDKIDYDPEAVAVFQMTHMKRSECTIAAGKGSTSTPTQTKYFAPYWSGGIYPFPGNPIVLDITEFDPINEDVFLSVYDGGTSTIGTLNSFSVEFYDTYDLSGATAKVITSPNPPMSTIQGGTIYALADMTPALTVDPLSHDFGTMNMGETDSWSFDITNTGGGTLTWNISESLSWLTVDPASGTTIAETDTITVDIDTTGLSPGEYNGMISVTSDGGNQDVSAEVSVTGSPQFPTNRRVAVSGSDVYVAYIDSNGYPYVKHSHDSGVSWAQKRVSASPASAVSVACSGTNAYVAYVNPNNGYPYVKHSHDSGVSWTQDRIAASAASTVSVASSGSDVYVAYVNSNNGYPYVKHSHDSGVSWTQKRIAASAASTGSVACSGSDAYVVYIDSSSSSLFLRCTHDNGATWMGRQLIS